MEEASRYRKPVVDIGHPYHGIRRLIAPGELILDVGCGSGDLAEFLRDSGAIFDGIEANAARAKLAEQFMRIVEVGTIAPGFEPTKLIACYDTIVAADVIEHVVDPIAFLGWCREHLRSGGRILCLIPNSAHWSVRRKVLRGDWSYSATGFFDWTHVRFYDLSTISALPDDAGLVEVSRELFADFWPHNRWPMRSYCLRRFPNLFAGHALCEWKVAVR
ncbi:MAG: class I SAM-dependent methyltransferase [Acidimicrobiales bacterium]